MKTLEIILRLIDKLLASIAIKKAQNEREKIEASPDDWFRTHFGYGVQSSKDKADKANPSNNA